MRPINYGHWLTWAALGFVAASCSLDDRDLVLPALGRIFGSDAGAGTGQLEVSPASIDLGSVATGFAARSRISVRNIGDAPIAAPSLRWSPGSAAELSIIQNQCLADLAPGESCEVRVQAVPTRPGALQGAVELQGAATVNVAAVGLQAGDLILAPAAGSFEDFGDVPLGAVVESTFTLSNPGELSTGPVQLLVNRSDVAFVPATAGECASAVTSLEPGQSCNLRLAFSPVARGPIDAMLTVSTQASGAVSTTLAGRGLVPGLLESSAAIVDFESVLLTQSARRAVTLTNTGDQALVLAGANLSPPGVAGFTISSSNCAAGSSLAPGQACGVEVEFRPPLAGEQMTGELQLSIVGGSQPLSVPLQGVGLAAGTIQIQPSTLGEEDFGDVQIGQNAEHVFQVQNAGAQASGVLDWSVSDGFEVISPPGPADCIRGSTSLVDGQSCSLRVRFSPTQRQVTNGSLLVSSALAGAYATALSGRGVITGTLEANPEASFGRVLTGASAARTLALINTGDLPVAPPTLVVSGNDPAQTAAFTFASACVAALAPGEACNVTVTFAPTAAVPHAATLELVVDARPLASVLLLGDALVPGSLVLAPTAGSSPDFGDVALGTSIARSFTLSNPAPVASGSLLITSDDNQFAIEPGDCNANGAGLVDGASCTFSVTFTPTESLAVAANVTVQSLGAGRAGIAVSGRGRRQAALAANGNRDLGSANIGQATLTAPENEFVWTVNNTGDLPTGALVVANDNPTEFSVGAETCGGAELASQASCTLTIRFQPTGTGPRTGNITVTDPAGMSSAPIVLTGLGVQLAGPGESCINAQCETGVCTRAGVCCDTECDRVCETCSAAGVCTALSGREACGNGAACFGVDQCKLPEGSACSAAGGGAECGSGFCQPRFGGTGDGDRICCLSQCGPGLACNAQGQCQQLTAGQGTACGGPSDLPCGANLVCKACVGSGTGQSQCMPADQCCGNCPAGLECVGGTSCDCPVLANGQRGIACADGCALRRADACCPEAPQCDPGERCDGSDHLCKQCLSNADCTNARPNSVPTCSQGTCSYPCAPNAKECNGACIPSQQCCSPADCSGRACNGGTCQAADCSSPGARQCSPQGVPQLCGQNGLLQNQTPCGAGQQCQGGFCMDLPPPLPGAGQTCADGQCAQGLSCAPFNSICCSTRCDGACQECSAGTGTCESLTIGDRCPQVTCPTEDFVNAGCYDPPRVARFVGIPCVNGQCATAADLCEQPTRPPPATCTGGGGLAGHCVIDEAANTARCEPD